MPTEQVQHLQGSLFEEDYLIRTLGSLVHSPDIALTELVANAWDAGATQVDITIPYDYGYPLVVEDNGVGLTNEQFLSRWMKLGYNRLKYQGREVKFPSNVEGNRVAYGRNGIGRHGLLCFDKEYRVITNSEGKQSTFVITTLNESLPFVIKEEAFMKSKKSGTRLEVVVQRNLPRPDSILEIISAKFLHDPKFKIAINGQTIQLEEHRGLIYSRPLTVGSVNMTAHFIDSQKAGRSTLYQGIAFWQSNRLIGEPSWVLGNEVVIDGRTKFAKRYTVVIKTDDLAEFILEDWTGLKKNEATSKFYKEVSQYVNGVFTEIAKDSIEDTKHQIRDDFAVSISSLPPLARYEVNEAIEAITFSHPTAKHESISLAVEAIINLEKTRTGKELLLKLSRLSEDDIFGVNTLLEKWSIRDALSVLDEIDNRLSVIEAIRKLSKDEEIDELHVLHPLVTGARWLFGPEFESAEYASNRQLQTVVEAVFKTKVQHGVFNNHRKRPDIVVLQDSIMSVTGTDSFDPDSHLSTINKILILELKRGGFKLTRKERDQATSYVEDFMDCGNLIGSPYIEAFVIGNSFQEKVQPISTVRNSNDVEMGKVRITTFGQLVDTAEKRLFGLRQRLGDRYDDIPGMQLFNQQSTQLKVAFID